MKKNKLKTITLILLIILITMVGFFGVYKKSGNIMKDDVKDYQYGMDLTGKRVVNLELDTTSKETIKDSDGNVIENASEDEIKEKGYTKEETPVNSEESKTLNNYNLTKEIIEKRLNKLNVSSYFVRVDEETGKIIVELPENDNTDNIMSNLTTVGKFEILDSDTKEVLLTNDDIKTSEVLRSTNTQGTAIYFAIEFNGEGQKKLEEISKTYLPASKQENNKEENNSEESKEESSSSSEEQDTTETATQEENKEENTNTEEKTEEAKDKQITMKIDDTDVMSTSFDEPITDGKLYLTVGQTTTDIKTLNTNMQQARNIATVLSYKNLPLTYNNDSNQYVESPVKDTINETVITAIAVVIGIIALLLIVKYKSNGLFSAISYVGFVATLLIMIRYWNVVLSIEGIVALFGVLILNYVLTNKILKNINKEENSKLELKNIMNTTIKEITLNVIPLFIVAIVFTFMQWTSTSSFGMVMFWGLALIALYNLLITKNLLKKKEM